MSIDSSFIIWGDQNIDIFSGNFSGCVYHRYNFRADSCVPNGFLKVDITLGFYDTCAAGYSLNSFSTAIYVRFKPHAEFTISPAIVCTNEPINLDLSKSCSNANTLVGEIVNYTWNMGNGTIINDSTTSAILPPPPPNDQYSTPGNYTITLTITNNCGTSSNSKLVKVLPPTKIFPSIVADSCAPTSFIPNMIDSNVKTLQWTSNFANFSDDTIRQPVVVVTPPGIYIFNVNATGCCFPPQSICSWSDTIKFNQGPSLSLQVSPPALCDSGYINPTDFFAITDPDTVIQSIQWSFPGGNPSISTVANPALVFYSSPGSYPISLIVISHCGNDTITDSVHVYGSPKLLITSSTLIRCDSIGISFNNTSVVSQNYAWNVPSPGIFISPTGINSPSPIISYNFPGNYPVIVVASTQPTCPSESDTFNIQLIPGPRAQLISNIPDSCTTATLSPLNYFNITGTIDSYSWSFAGGNPSSDTTATPPFILYDTVGIYIVSLITSDALCGSDSITDTFYVSAPPTLSIVPDSLSGCGTLTVDFTNNSPAGQIYTWSAPNGIFAIGNSTSTSPGIYYSGPGKDTINVIVSTPGCIATPTLDFPVFVGESPHLSTTSLLSIPDGCDSNFIFQWFNYFTLTTSPSDSGYSWQVYLDNINIYNDISTTPADFHATSTGEYIFIASVWNNCDTILLGDTFHIFSPGTILLSSDTIICKDGGILALSATPPSGNWYQNGSTTSLSTPIFDPHIATSDTNKFVYIYAQGTDCEIADSFLVFVSGREVTAGSDIALCNNIGNLILTGGFPVNGVWSGITAGNPTSQGDYDPGLVLLNTDTLVYTYSNSTTFCATEDTMVVTINIPANALFTIPDTVCIGNVVPFINNTPNTSSLWSFGDPSPNDTNTTINHIYTTDNFYIASLVTIDQAGCRDTALDSITVLRPPDASFIPDTTSLCAGTPLYISNTSSFTNYSLYIWNYGNGITDTTFIPDTVYFTQNQGSSGIYPIILQSLNRCGSASDTQMIFINQTPFANVGYSQGDGCSPDTVRFSNVSLGGNGLYTWFINGSLASVDSSIVPQLFLADSVDAIYHFTLTATNACGSDSFTDSVRVHPGTVSAFFKMSSAAVCKYDTVRFISYSTPGSYIYWDFGDGTTANGDTVDYAYSTSGVFNVMQIAYQCGVDTANLSIIINDIPQASFNVVPVSCTIDTVPFNNTSFSANPNGSFWYFGDGTFSNLTNPTHHYIDSGLYMVSLVLTDAPTGCYDSTSQSLSIVADPHASFYIPNLDGCRHTIQIVNNSTGADYYIWNMGNNDVLTDPQPVYTYNDTGSYTITLTASNNNLCSDDTSFSYVLILPLPQAIFTPDPYHQSILNPHFEFINLSTGDSIISHAWYFGDGTSAYDFQPFHYYTDTGIYQVELRIYLYFTKS